MNLPAQIRQHVREYGPVIGSLLDEAIYDWVRLEDGLYRFLGVAPGPRPGIIDMSQVRSHEVVLPPGLLYCPVSS